MPANYRPLYTRPTFVDESLFGTPNETAVKMSRSMPASVRNGVTVMGAQELSNIGFRAKSKGGETGLAHQRRLERDRLQKLSDERKAKWPNTIEAARAAKEKQRKAKLDAEEALRQQIDAEEEALNVEKRRLAIERANKMLYHGTDRVKELHSKLLLADVMQERECQIELKKKLKQACPKAMLARDCWRRGFPVAWEIARSSPDSCSHDAVRCQCCLCQYRRHQ